MKYIWKGVIEVLSFEEKKAVFHSFNLKEKKISNGRVSFVYPESLQKGQVLATQLHPSGNGYVNGKYMSRETIEKHGFEVDPRGWISIKVFSNEEIANVITEAMKSMMKTPDVADVIIEKKTSHTSFEKQVGEDIPFGENVPQTEASFEIVKIPEKTDISMEKQGISSKEIERKLGSKKNESIEIFQPSSTYEMYPGSCLFALMGLTLSTMEYGLLVWRKVVRKYVGIGSKM
ncbi:hypothetical protein QNH20_04760 [Neobacillus sp. WH10]|uniref:hypothetical protein n=1 Tax=Neobacillus sp. WH10 TaxID=3047873 RepID=UPI0024C1A38A|nr:hypothetical protein [Neobacillus sp. WH10]WHY78463.1 hypothetical protein QNH20_04760 [Neobacillus sp. WH10]